MYADSVVQQLPQEVGGEAPADATADDGHVALAGVTVSFDCVYSVGADKG